MTYLRQVAQAKEEGIVATKQHLLTCALTAKNCLWAIEHSTPTIATFGKQPAILLNLETATAQLDDSHTGLDGLSR